MKCQKPLHSRIQLNVKGGINSKDYEVYIKENREFQKIKAIMEILTNNVALTRQMINRYYGHNARQQVKSVTMTKIGHKLKYNQELLQDILLYYVKYIIVIV